MAQYFMTYEKTFVPWPDHVYCHAGITYYDVFVFGAFQDQYGHKTFMPYPYLKSLPYSTNVYDTWPTNSTTLDYTCHDWSGDFWLVDETTTTVYAFHNPPMGVAIPFPENTEFCWLNGFCVYRDAPDPYAVYSTDNMETNEDEVRVWDGELKTGLEVPRGNLIERRKFGFFVPGKHWNALAVGSSIGENIAVSAPEPVWPDGDMNYWYLFTRIRVCLRLYADDKEIVMYQELTRIYNDKYPATIIDRFGNTVTNPKSLWFGQYEAPYEPSGIYPNFDYYSDPYTDPKYYPSYYNPVSIWSELYLKGTTHPVDAHKEGTWFDASSLLNGKPIQWFIDFPTLDVSYELGLIGRQPITAMPILGEDDVIDGAN